MAALSDHDRRDAEHASRAEIAILLQKYARRLTEEAKVYIKEELDAAAREGRSIDGTALGRAAAAHATGHYFLEPDTRPAIEGRADPADGFA